MKTQWLYLLHVPECSLVDCETPVASELTGASSREQKVEYCLLLKDGTGITVQPIIIADWLHWTTSGLLDYVDMSVGLYVRIHGRIRTFIPPVAAASSGCDDREYNSVIGYGAGDQIAPTPTTPNEGRVSLQ